MLRSCGEAPASSASRTNGSRSVTRRVGGELLHRGQRADVQRVLVDGDPAQRQAADVDQPVRVDHAVLQHQVELGGAAGQVGGRPGRRSPSRPRRPTSSGRTYSNGSHRYAPLSATSRIAATMFGYAPQRQRLPLMYSRISSSEPARPSSQQRDRRHDLARRAVAALEGVVTHERLLHRMQPSVAAPGPRSWSPPGRRTARPASGTTAPACRRAAPCRRRRRPGRSPSSCRSARGARATRRAASPGCPRATAARAVDLQRQHPRLTT